MLIINQRQINASQPPYIIAEMSANHNGSLERAKQLILEAKKAGADAVKLQTYKPDTITLNSNKPEFQLTKGLWAGKNLYELYEWAHTPWEWHQPLFDYAKELSITIFSSPFDFTAVDLLEKLNVPAYKIASFELVDIPLIKYVASTGKPLIMSTGMANLAEIEVAVNAAQQVGAKQLALLHCVSGYPAPAEDYNLLTLADMRKHFNLEVGLSDHTLDNTTAITSVALGASIIEKHFTLNRNDGGPDDSFSLEPAGLKELCTSTKIAWQALGKVSYDLKPSEVNDQKNRRSLYFIKDMKAGDIITSDSIKSVRPGYGLPPVKYEQLLGKKLIKDVNFADAVTLEVIEN